MSLELPMSGLSDSIERITSDFVIQLDDHTNRLNANKQQLEQLVLTKDLVGDPLRSGCLRKMIHQGHVYGTGGPAGVGSKGEYPRVDLGTTESVYVHYRLPLNINRDVCMFWFRILGYCYGAAKPLKETFVGYCYSEQTALKAVHTQGNFSPAVYVDASGNVVLRLFFPYIYYTTFSMDTMTVGIENWMRLFGKDDIEVRLSLVATLNFG